MDEDARAWTIRTADWISSVEPVSPITQKFSVLKSRSMGGAITFGTTYVRDDGVWIDLVVSGRQLTDGEVNHLVDWSTENLSETARVYYDWLIFADQADAFAFKMRWSGVPVTDLCRRT
jgi:hypothetical protein